jgi:hypothetical protein
MQETWAEAQARSHALAIAYRAADVLECGVMRPSIMSPSPQMA